jgi:hypothetical protein
MTSGPEEMRTNMANNTDLRMKKHRRDAGATVQIKFEPKVQALACGRQTF